jgi:hypothetical protein
LQVYSNEIKDHPINFVNAFDEFKAINRKLFNIPNIDRFLSFSDKKNICIVNRSHQSISFLYSIITRICINYHTTDKKSDNVEKNKTILIDAGNGNNLGYAYLNLIDESLKNEFDINKVLDKIIIVRAFTFYQLVNIVINEIPKLIQQLVDCKIQIIILDLLGTLLSSSNKIRTNGKDNYTNVKNDFNYNAKLLDEIIDNLINISNKYFVILSYDHFDELVESSIVSKFSNIIEINQIYNITTKKKKKDASKIKLIIKIKSNNTNNILLSIDKITDLTKDYSINTSVI